MFRTSEQIEFPRHLNHIKDDSNSWKDEVVWPTRIINISCHHNQFIQWKSWLHTICFANFKQWENIRMENNLLFFQSVIVLLSDFISHCLMFNQRSLKIFVVKLKIDLFAKIFINKLSISVRNMMRRCHFVKLFIIRMSQSFE